jgi:hypothetical protein
MGLPGILPVIHSFIHSSTFPFTYLPFKFANFTDLLAMTSCWPAGDLEEQLVPLVSHMGAIPSRHQPQPYNCPMFIGGWLTAAESVNPISQQRLGVDRGGNKLILVRVKQNRRVANRRKELS